MPEANTPRKRTRKISMKVCVKCGKVLPLNDFYHNRDWADQSYRDAWCKKCANEFCTTRESLKEYCWYNNRVWADEYYDQALNRAMRASMAGWCGRALRASRLAARRTILSPRPSRHWRWDISVRTSLPIGRCWVRDIRLRISFISIQRLSGTTTSEAAGYPPTPSLRSAWQWRLCRPYLARPIRRR